MAVDTQKRNKRQYEWQKDNSDRINFLLPKGLKAIINETAKANGQSASEFMRDAIIEKLKACGANVCLQSPADMVK